MSSTMQKSTISNKPNSIIKFESDQESKHRKPIKAIIPLKTWHRTSPLRLKNRISPDAEVIPHLDLSPVGKSFAWVVGTGRSFDQGSAYMRRTASLDAIFLKGSKESDSGLSLLLNKSTQTPEDWVPCCLTEVNSKSVGVSVESSNNSLPPSGTSERTLGSVPSSPSPIGSIPTTGHGENLEKFIRQRLQRTNKEGAGGFGSLYSPIPGDHSILAKPYACVQTNMSISGDGAMRSVSVPQLPQPLLPLFRSSVEELNQEIERLVLRPQSYHGSEEDEEEDGRRAPFPDYFRCRRSINTQTSGQYSSSFSDNLSDQSMSPTLSPPPVQVATPPGSPTGPLQLSSIASPHMNKFLTKEPPDGCEKVSLKLSEEKSESTTARLPVTKPSTIFTLLPSLGSAFYTPDRTISLGGGIRHQTETNVEEEPRRKMTELGSPARTKDNEKDQVSNFEVPKE